MVDDSKEYISSAAIWYDDGIKHHYQSVYGIETGFVIGCFRHACCPFPQNHAFNPQEDELSYPCKGKATVTQGFITSYGRFVSREEASRIAKSCGQVKVGIGKTLFSEDVFPYQIFRAT